MEPPLDRRRVRLATGLEASYLTWGDGPHTVFLLHGFLDAAVGWVAAVEAGLVRPGLRLIAPDWRGHGDSEWIGPGGYYHFLDYLADLRALVRHAGGERLSLVGHSMGGSVAAYYAGSFPAEVHRLVLLEGLGPPVGTPTGPERVAQWLRQWDHVRTKPQKTYADVEAAAARLTAVDPRLPAPLARRIAAETTRAHPAGGVAFKHDPLHVTEGPHGFDVAVAERFWRAVTCETLLIDGADSTFTLGPEETARREACLLGGRARKATIPGAGHMLQRHQPEAVARLVGDFLAPTAP